MSSCVFVTRFRYERRALQGFLMWSQCLRCCTYRGGADHSQFSQITAEDEDAQHLLGLRISPGGRLTAASSSRPPGFHLH